MREQAKEEIEHAMRIYSYIEDRGNRVEFLPITAPPKNWNTVQDVIEQSLQHEETMMERFNNLMDVAAAESDHATSVFLQWFVSEQVEEESTFQITMDDVERVRLTCSAMLFLDKNMAKRAEN